jgi:hypothetical protein
LRQKSSFPWIRLSRSELASSRNELADGDTPLAMNGINGVRSFSMSQNRKNELAAGGADHQGGEQGEGQQDGQGTALDQ